VNKKEKKGISLLLKWAGEDKKHLYFSIVCALLSSILSIIPYYSFYQIIDAVYLRTCSRDFLLRYALIIIFAAMLRFLFSSLSGISSHRGAYNTLFRVRCMVTEHMSKMPLGSLNERSTGEIKNVMTENIEKLELFLAHNLPELIMYLSGPIIIFIYLCTVNVPLALISLIPLVLAILVMGIMFIKSSKFMDNANKSGAELNGSIIEYINGMRVIKAYNMGSSSFKKYANAIEAFHTLWVKMAQKLGSFYASYIVVLECGLLFIVPLGGYWFMKGSITASVLLLFSFVGTQYLTDIRPLQELGSNLSYVMNGVTQVKNILDTPIFEVGVDFPEKYNIEFKNVGFAYSDDKEVLKNCNLNIKAGEKTAFVGESGAGKTTAVKLISRFYDVTKGEILIGDTNVKDLNYEKLLENISIVFQNSFLTSGSVYENIAMGGNATLDEVRKAAKQAQIDNFIISLPHGYNTLVGSYGTRFSGGQKQRICIARAILKNAPILILDEATSAADPENQLEIDMAIENLCKGKTVIIVAHRLGIVQSCDKIAVIKNNTISNVGTWEEVLESSDYFKKAWGDYNQAREMSYSLKGGIA
jgi:ATP-binding cassette subfamily B protein